MNTEKVVPVTCFYADVTWQEEASIPSEWWDDGAQAVKANYFDKSFRIFGTREFIGRVSEFVNTQRRKALGWK